MRKEKTILKRSRLAVLSFVIFFILLFQILSMRQPGPNPAILHVSIPAGEDRTRISDPDPWLSECWLFNITVASGTFTVTIEDVSGHISSYDTHLVIALNDAAYNNLVSLTVDNVTIVKNDFRYGTLRPYNLRNWPSGDVYPTWFNDTLVNVGTIPQKGHTNVTVSVAFSNATGARMHFDAYGSKKSSPIPPTKKSYITHNPLSEDSTVLFWPPPLIPPVACFTVSNDHPNVCETVTFNATCSYDPNGWIVNYTWNFGDSNITTVAHPIITHHYDTFGNYTATLTVTDNDGLNNSASKPIWVREHPVARFTYSPPYPQACEVVVFNASDSTPDGGYIVNYTWNFGDSNITTVTDPIITHHYTAPGDYNVTLTVTDSEGKSDTTEPPIVITVVAIKYYLTVQTDPASIVTIPGEGWYGNCTYVNLTAPQYVDVSADTRYRFDYWDVNGTSQVVNVKNITVHMDGNYTATAHYVLQYQVTFTQTGLSSDASGTVVTVDGVAKTFSDLPYTAWVDNGTVVTYSYEATVSSTIMGERFNLTGVTGPSSPFTVTGPVTVMGNYKTQYEITFDQTGVGSDFIGTVVTIDGTNYGVGALPVSFWWDNCTTHSFDFKSPLTVTPNAKQYVWTSTSGLSTLQSDSIHVSGSGSVIGNYKTQYYLTVTSPYDSPTPTSGWFDAGTGITASVTSPWPGPAGTQYVCTGWTGTGSVPASGTTTTVTFTINAPSSITWNWKTQYYLTVRTDPSGIVTIPGEGWYDSSTDVALTALTLVNYNFINWDVDGVSQGPSVNPITVHMDGPHTATAHYQSVAPPPPAVGGHVIPIDKTHLLAQTNGLAPRVGLAFALLAAMVVTVILIRRRTKTL